jgi:hypothetical protein
VSSPIFEWKLPSGILTGEEGLACDALDWATDMEEGKVPATYAELSVGELYDAT